jgi:hypothetical protein
VLHCAAETGDLSVFRGVFELLPFWIGKELMNKVDRSGRNVVHLVLQSGHVDCLKWLLNFIEIDNETWKFLTARDAQKNNIFHFVVKSKLDCLVPLMLSLPRSEVLELMSQKNAFDLTPVMLVAAESNEEFTEVVLDFVKSEAQLSEFTKLMFETDRRHYNPLHHAMSNQNGTLRIWSETLLEVLDRNDMKKLLMSKVPRQFDNIVHVATERISDPDLLVWFYDFVKAVQGDQKLHQLLLDWNLFQRTIIHKAIKNAAITEMCLEYLEAEIDKKKLTEFLTDKGQQFILAAVREAEIPALTAFLDFYTKVVPANILASKLTADLNRSNTLLAAVLRNSEVAVFYFRFLRERSSDEVLEQLVNQTDEYGRSVAQLTETLDSPELVNLIKTVMNT